jgi:hypothetical protein
MGPNFGVIQVLALLAAEARKRKLAKSGVSIMLVFGIDVKEVFTAMQDVQFITCCVYLTQVH